MFSSGVLVTALVGIVSTIVSGWASYFFTRKKYNSEVDLNLIEKMQGSLDFYMKLSEDNKRILDETLAKLEESEKRNDALETEIRELRNQMFTLMSQICVDLSCSARKAYAANKVKPKKTEKE
jgi:TRAP-type C4-dicarboxylate transport system substrate-binding protein